MLPPEDFQGHRIGKFVGLAEASLERIGHGGEGLGGDGDFGQGKGAGPGPRQAGNSPDHGLGVFFQGVPVLAVSFIDQFEDVPERRHTADGLLGKVGAAPERSAVGHQEQGQRPAGRQVEDQGRRLELAVQVGALLPVDENRREEAVDEGRRFRVFITFPLHDMAPVAGQIANRQQDRLAAFCRLGQGLRRPGPPMDRIGGMQLKVGAGFRAEPVMGRIGQPGGRRRRQQHHEQ